VLLFSDHELSFIRRRVFLRFWMVDFQEILWGGIARSKEKTSLVCGSRNSSRESYSTINVPSLSSLKPNLHPLKGSIPDFISQPWL
jgi:hypothetical protein